MFLPSKKRGFRFQFSHHPILWLTGWIHKDPMNSDQPIWLNSACAWPNEWKSKHANGSTYGLSHVKKNTDFGVNSRMTDFWPTLAHSHMIWGRKYVKVTNSASDQVLHSMAKPIHQLAVSCMTQHLTINPARGQLGVAQLALLDEGKSSRHGYDCRGFPLPGLPVLSPTQVNCS